MVQSSHFVRSLAERELVERYRRVTSKPPVSGPGPSREDHPFVDSSSYTDLKAASDELAAQGRIDFYA